MSYWDNRRQYYTIVDDFVRGETGGVEFETRFTERWREDRDESLSHPVEPDDSAQEQKREALERALSQVFTACDVFDPDPTTRTQYEYSEEELRQFVGDLFRRNLDLFR